MPHESFTKSETYQWVITTLVGLLCFAAGMLVQSERYTKQIVTNTVEIRQLKDSLIDINIKLDRALSREYAK